MWPYWIIFAGSAIGAVHLNARRNRAGRVGIGFGSFMILLILMAGLRWNVGGDWSSYLLIFEFLRYSDLGEVLRLNDPAYTFLNWLAVQLGVGIWFVNFICATIFVWGLMRFCAQQPNPWLTVAVAIPYLVIVVGMGYTRQAVAIGILLAGLASLRQHQSLLRFAGYMIAAALFHRTAIVILPLIAMAMTSNRWLVFGGAIALGAILYYFLVAGQLEIMVQNYIGASYEAEGALVRVLMNMVPAVLLLGMLRRFTGDEFDRRLWRNFAIAAVISLPALFVVQGSVVVDRFGLYLIPLQLIVFSRLPYVFSGSPAQSLLLTYLIVFYSAVVQLIWLFGATHARYWLPYQNLIVL